MLLAASAETVPLIPRQRLTGSPLGGYTSIRRGEGSDIASSRPYEPGDHVRAIDWKSSARISAAHATDEFIVRERHSEEMSRVVLVVDRRPSMSLYPADLPWLRKPRAVRAAANVLVASALTQRALVGYLDFASHEGESAAGEPFWQPPRAQLGTWQGDLAERVEAHLEGGFDAPEDTVDRALAHLDGVRSALPIGTFVFVISDFTGPLAPTTFARALALGWDLVPVVVQDAVWEQSFPAIDGVLVPFADPGRRRLRSVRLTANEVESRRLANEARLRKLRSDFAGLGLDAVIVGSGEMASVHAAFLDWADGRLALRGGHR